MQNQFQVSAGFYIETSHLIFHCSAGLRRVFFLYQHLHIKQNITITRPTCIYCNIPGTKNKKMNFKCNIIVKAMTSGVHKKRSALNLLVSIK